MSLDSLPEPMAAEFVPRSLDDPIAEVLAAFEHVKRRYDLNLVRSREQYLKTASTLQHDLDGAISALSIDLLGRRIDVAGDMYAAEKVVHAGISVGYKMGQLGPTQNHLDGTLEGVSVMPLPSRKMAADERQARRYEHDTLGTNPFGLCLSLEQLAVIRTRDFTKGGVERVEFPPRSTVHIALGYTGLVAVEAIPREAIIAHYGL